ncbi:MULTISPECIES: Mov34/MPN/PAD-1 family protein [Burkholderia cepacia complex]|uniref:Mov34/MPN/PAD-1 family protein n=1 Tax=Burkholderia cepacia complex TaxID=87882 RepID=UPI001CF2BED2|nr:MULTISPECIES: Mov34/MPN/PAD-1 family protein [Burkholderia cepacia complex]MCA8057138.1 Mov34/MPN/PAD-1 family protein [Burkholderia cepacia]MDN7534672.1 Mov34/MPN/PAD-1 family protein [Burkholderia orbicola]
MKLHAISYRLPGATWSLRFSEPAIQTLLDHVQHSHTSKESVGQLFVRDLMQDPVLVEVATVLVPTRAAWTRVTFNTDRAMTEREALFEKGLHCIGLWHTHPEPSPTPSTDDRMLAREHALAARPQLAGIVFVIVGTMPTAAGIRVWVDDGNVLREATVDEEQGGGAYEKACGDSQSTRRRTGCRK